MCVCVCICEYVWVGGCEEKRREKEDKGKRGGGESKQIGGGEGKDGEEWMGGGEGSEKRRIDQWEKGERWEKVMNELVIM